MTTLPPGLTLHRLTNRPGREHEAARQFCLDTILEFYGFPYRQDWHLDLDSLLLPAEDNHYSASHGGAFWTLTEADGSVAATAGIRHLAWKPNVVAMFPGRYARGEEVASLWRVYVRKDRRRHGLGRWLTELCEAEAARLGYGTMYLHASSEALATVAFWQSMGYVHVGTCETSTHFDKRLAASPAAVAQPVA